jgi:alpha-glucuronidase
MQRAWSSVERTIDPERFREVRDFLAIQEAEARWWRDATVQYFATFSRLPLPPGYEPPAHPLSYYLSLRCPSDPRKPRCPAIH